MKNIDFERLLGTVARILFWVLKHVVVPLVLVVIYIVLANVGDLGYFLLFAMMIVLVYHLLLALREIAGTLKKLKPAELAKLAADLADHVNPGGRFHLTEADWTDLKRSIPDDLATQLRVLERFMQATEGFDLEARLREFGDLQTNFAVLNRLVTVDQTAAIAAAVKAQAELTARVEVVEQLEKSVRDLAERLQVIVEGLTPRVETLEQKPDPEQRIAILETGSGQLALAVAAIQKTLQTIEGDLAALKQAKGKGAK